MFNITPITTAITYTTVHIQFYDYSSITRLQPGILYITYMLAKLQYSNIKPIKLNIMFIRILVPFLSQVTYHNHCITKVSLKIVLQKHRKQHVNKSTDNHFIRLVICIICCNLLFMYEYLSYYA